TRRKPRQQPRRASHPPFLAGRPQRRPRPHREGERSLDGGIAARVRVARRAARARRGSAFARRLSGREGHRRRGFRSARHREAVHGAIQGQRAGFRGALGQRAAVLTVRPAAQLRRCVRAAVAAHASAAASHAATADGPGGRGVAARLLRCRSRGRVRNGASRRLVGEVHGRRSQGDRQPRAGTERRDRAAARLRRVPRLSRAPRSGTFAQGRGDAAGADGGQRGTLTVQGKYRPTAVAAAVFIALSCGHSQQVAPPPSTAAEEAALRLRDADRAAKGDPAAAVHAGWLHYLVASEAPQAEQRLRAAATTATGPSRAIALCGIAEILEDRLDTPAAVSAWIDALRVAPQDPIAELAALRLLDVQGDSMSVDDVIIAAAANAPAPLAPRAARFLREAAARALSARVAEAGPEAEARAWAGMGAVQHWRVAGPFGALRVFDLPRPLA